MSNNLIEQFNFSQMCKIMTHHNGVRYCMIKGIDYLDFYNSFCEKSKDIIDNNDYHFVYKNGYYNDSIGCFMCFTINSSDNFIDLAVIKSTLENISYLDAIIELYSNQESFDIYESFSSYFDDLKGSESGKELILQALTEKYLLLENDDVLDTLENFITTFLNSNYIQKIRDFFTENYNVENESVGDCLLACFEDNYSFEKQIISYSNEHDFSEIEQQLNELQQELKQGSLSNKNKLKKGF